MQRPYLLILLFVYAMGAYTQNYLFNNGQTRYTIIVSSDASKSEQTAAQELQSYVEQISGVRIPIASRANSSGNNIYIGYNDVLSGKAHIARPAADDQSFAYRTIGSDLLIYGGSQLGTMYGVFSFLENELGVRWYTPSYTKIPQMKRFELKALNHTESPVIRYRIDYFLQTINDKAWLAHNLVNANNTISSSKYGRLSAIWGVHTFAKFIPPADYFSSHPEYFGVYEGKRSPKTQLCLSNEDMCREFTVNLKRFITEHPGFWCYDVSQNDNRFPCECRNCQALVRKYGGQSGALLWFVNKVAAEIREEFPDTYISTLAYSYTRQPPTSTIVPADNVVIRLSDIACCMAHPIDQCAENKAFVQDFKNWQRITKNITIWDYTTGFSHYLMPFPNFDVLAYNYRFLSQSGVMGILELGSWNAPWSEFSELKQWLVAKLLWNPSQETDSLVTVFIDDYYGNAAPYVKAYYDLCRHQIKSDTHFTVKIECDTELYDDQFLNTATRLLEDATRACGDDETRRRTNRLAAQIYYLQLKRHTTRAILDGTARKLLNIADSDSTIVGEHKGSIQDFVHELNDY